jgi:cell division septation protein DedD
MAGRRHGAFPGEDDDALPWLEPAEADYEDEVEDGSPYSRLILIGIAVVAVVAVLWFVAARFGGEKGGTEIAGEVPLIRAPTGPYKVRPKEPGGLEVDQDSMTHAVAEGKEPGSRIALDALPEEPVPIVAATSSASSAPAPEATEPPAPAAKSPQPEAKAAEPTKEAPEPMRQAEREQAATPSTQAATVQLGAFSSASAAETVWSKLAGKVPALSALHKSVEPVKVGASTLYRLRAGGLASEGAAEALCGKVKATGEQCAIVH